ncbi:bidirectional sugar transporter SWEET2a-like [Pyrus x bretschneideri]|uniref:bidirectional sugar transporter SWEET2a-like n=1 Tax=Pyrus x bretschneideri TaxID=225117 RepID=UPI0005117718|nr:bidirectional sugar transporter SWEET2a-like [Pyrus x bretschneideri]
MLTIGLSSVYLWCSTAAGIAGNICAISLYLSPMPTFKRIITNRSTEQFSGLPYIYGLLNCLICTWYGLPIVKSGIIMVATVNSIGAVFQLVYLIIFIMYAEKSIKLRISGLLGTVSVLFAAVVLVSLRLSGHERELFVGYICAFSVVSVYASPLFIINLVIKTRSVEFMPFNLSLATFLVSFSFCAYGALQGAPFVYIPNGLGTILGFVQLVLYSYYCRISGDDDSREPLLV